MNTELQNIEQNVIVLAFQQPNGVNDLFEKLAEEARSFVPDVTTKKGRDAIGSLAAKVSKSKVLVETYAKDLVAEQKAKIKLVDDDRIAFSKKMDNLRNEVLAPRDAWEQAEKDRVEKHKSAIDAIQRSSLFSTEATAADIKEALSIVENTVIDACYEEFEQMAKLARMEAMEAIRHKLAEREKYEAEQAELARLRVEAAERVRIEHEQRIAEAAATKARAEAEAIARAESERVEREKREAIEQAERQQREAAEREARLKEEAQAAVMREQKAKQDAVEAAKRAEVERAQAVEAERKRVEKEAEAKRLSEIAAEQARKANQEHMRKINQEVLATLTEVITEDQAKEVIRLIAKGMIPHISIKY